MHTRTGPILLAIGAALMLSACTGVAAEQPVDGMTSVVAEGGMPAPGAPVGDAMVADSKEGSTVGQGREVIRTAYVSMRVEDVGRAARDLHGLVARSSGLISSEDSQVNGESNYATITAQVPAAALDAFLSDVAGLGTVDSVNVTAADVTTQVVDLDARIAALKTSIDRMSTLLAQAEQIDDLLAIETQLSTRQAELDSLTAQRTWLGDQVAMSAVTVSLSPTTAPLADADAPGFVSGLRSGWAAFTAAIAVAVTAVGFLLPFSIILLVVLVPLIAIAVRQGRRRAHGPSTPAPAAEETARSSRSAG